MVDFGCGVGSWLREFELQGVEDVRGLDGPWVDEKNLQIDAARFNPCDLTQPVVLDWRFDLALCLEVAEHMSVDAADTLVDNVCRASDVVMFSAAIPGQGGTHHLNEQWPEYWCEKFARRDYEPHDCLRNRFWLDAAVSWWFRQNMMLFIKRDAAARHRPSFDNVSSQVVQPLSLVHPALYEQRLRELASTRAALSPSTASIRDTFVLLVGALGRKMGVRRATNAGK